MPVLVAGGINLASIDKIVAEEPDVVVVGGAITSTGDPQGVAAALEVPETLALPPTFAP